MESIAARRFGGFLALIAGSDGAPELLDARASSFEAVYNAHYSDVSRHVILKTRGRDDVEEIVAETFARAFAAWRTGHGPAGRPLPWLLVIARRIATDRWRRRRLIAWLPLPDGLRRSPGNWDGRELTAAEPGGMDRAAGVAEFWLWLDALSQALPARHRARRSSLLHRLRRVIEIDPTTDAVRPVAGAPSGFFPSRRATA